jgi:hypothetical protein
MAPADHDDRVTKVEVGETVHFFDDDGSAVARPRCDLDKGGWYCATHRKGLVNPLLKDRHIASGEHLLAWVCFKHGAEDP